jgi:hypothetical protein
MTVRRTLPSRERSLIGPWCLVDHFGPDDVAASGGMQVPGHPHTGLQTLTWLFSGEVEHHDTTGAVALAGPGTMTLMTAGVGVAHSEFSTPSTSVLRGIQLWIALPKAHRFTRRAFEVYTPDTVAFDSAQVRVLLGRLGRYSSPARCFSSLVAAEVLLSPGRSATIDVDPRFEHGLLLDRGRIRIDGAEVAPGELAYRPPGSDQLLLTAGQGSAARLLLLGGTPFGEQIVMWWNFVARSHEEIVEFRQRWQDHISSAQPPSGDGAPPDWYGQLPAVWDTVLKAPPMPDVRLKPRT